MRACNTSIIIMHLLHVCCFVCNYQVQHSRANAFKSYAKKNNKNQHTYQTFVTLEARGAFWLCVPYQ